MKHWSITVMEKMRKQYPRTVERQRACSMRFLKLYTYVVFNYAHDIGMI